MGFLFHPLDRLNWPSANTRDIEDTCTLDQLENHCSTVDMPFTVENAAVTRNSPVSMCQDQIQNSTVLGSPIRHESLFGKFDALLNLCKDHILTICISPSLTLPCRWSKFLYRSAEWRYPEQPFSMSFGSLSPTQCFDACCLGSILLPCW
jgi:hypothetical protein